MALASLGLRRQAAPLRHVDMTLVGSALALMVTGMFLVYFATGQRLAARGIDEYYYLKRVSLYMVVAVVAMVVTALIDYRIWKGYIPLLYGGTLVILALVLSPFGSEAFGARRGFALPGFEIDPGEFAKPAIIIVLAYLIAERRGEMELRDVVRCLAVAGVPAALIFLQPDFGSMLVFVAIALGVLLVGGAQPKHLVLLIVGGVAAAGLLVQVGVLKEYQIKRFTAFIQQSDRPTEDDGPGYNVAQAKQAVSAGGLFGRGPANATQTNLGFVPVQESDFIFTAMAEVYGFVGCVFLLGLYAVFLWRVWRICALARDQFGQIIAAGVLSMLTVQMFINVGMTLGMMPVTGLPLPLISLGGSSMVATCICIGLLLNIHMRRFT